MMSRLLKLGLFGCAVLICTVCFSFSDTNENLNCVYRVEKALTWAVGDSGLILRRSGSPAWQPVDVAGIVQEDWDFHGVFFLNSNIGWVVGENNRDPNNHLGIVLKTTNGGQTWLISWPSPPPGVGAIPFYDVHFANQRHGWISAGEGYKLRTNDGGDTWVWMLAERRGE